MFWFKISAYYSIKVTVILEYIDLAHTHTHTHTYILYIYIYICIATVI